MNDTLLSRVQSRLPFYIGGGTIALAVCGIGAIFNPRQFFISYLFAYLFWLGLSLGCLCVAMIHYLTGGRWGDVTRRFLEAGCMTLPMMAVLFLPIFAGLHILYPWAQPAVAAQTGTIIHRAHYMNVTGFVARSILYFTIWTAMAMALRRWSLRQDKTEDVEPTRMARALSGPGVVIYTLGVTFAWIDWMMSLESDWYSTMFPIIICGGQILSTFAFAILMLADFRAVPPYSDVVEPGHFHHLGNLLLTFVIFWTYVCFGQLLIIWSGNLPHEIVWYLHRIAGDWKWIAGFLAAFNFFLPFFILLFRPSKKNPQRLRVLAGLVFLCQIINAYWLLEPAFFQTGLHVHWMDFLAPVGIGGLWLAMFSIAFKRAHPLTRHDPRISYSFAHAE
jgi:hypothetical protein